MQAHEQFGRLAGAGGHFALVVLAFRILLREARESGSAGSSGADQSVMTVEPVAAPPAEGIEKANVAPGPSLAAAQSFPSYANAGLPVPGI